MRFLVVMDAPACIHPTTDTTLVVIEEALARGHTVDICVPERLELDGGEPVAEVESVTHAGRTLVPCMHLAPGQKRPLAAYQAVLMRKDPPFDLDYYFATLILERARGKTLLVNDPRGLRDANEKLYIFHFPELIAPTRVTRSIAGLRRFLDEHGGQMVVKPLDGCGGAGVFHVRADDRNTNVILETVTDFGKKLVMVQSYLPEAREGDKRILLLHAGGTAIKATLTERDHEICARVGKKCREDGLYLVGLDVIGGRLTEVNVTSPTGVQEVDRLDGTRLETRIVAWLEERGAIYSRP